MRQDDSYLLDMLVAARKAAQFAQGLTYESFLQSELHQNAILKVLEIIGEAASCISDAAKEVYPEIPWPNIVGLRNRIVHAYFEIDLGVVWNIINDDVPALIHILECIVPEEAE